MKTKEIIKQMMLDKPDLKDNDNKLIATYWFKELQRKNIYPETITALDFLRKYADAELTNAETIRRMRAKLQEEHPELRGRAYEIRQEAIQNKWRNELGYDSKKS
jgi:hypothetical protein